MTRELSLAPATVRRHLDVLLRDGVVEMRTERRALGRPHFVFSLSDEGRDSLPSHQLRLSLDVLGELLELRASDTRGRSGREVAQLLFDRLVQRLAEECTEEPVTSVAALEAPLEALMQYGIVFRIEKDERGYILQSLECPCARLLGGGADECSHDATILGTILGDGLELVSHSRERREFVLRPSGHGAL